MPLLARRGQMFSRQRANRGPYVPFFPRIMLENGRKPPFRVYCKLIRHYAFPRLSAIVFQMFSRSRFLPQPVGAICAAVSDGRHLAVVKIPRAFEFDIAREFFRCCVGPPLDHAAKTLSM